MIREASTTPTGDMRYLEIAHQTFGRQYQTSSLNFKSPFHYEASILRRSKATIGTGLSQAPPAWTALKLREKRQRSSAHVLGWGGLQIVEAEKEPSDLFGFATSQCV